MPVTSRRGALSDDKTVYRQLSFWVTGGELHALRFVKLSPIRWQQLYGEIQILRGARVSSRNGIATLLVPIAGYELEVLVSQGMQDDRFVICSDPWDPSSGT